MVQPQTPDIYLIANPGNTAPMGRWIKAQLDAGTITAAQKEHVIAIINDGIEYQREVSIDDDNTLRLTVTASAIGTLTSTLRAMGWNGE